MSQSSANDEVAVSADAPAGKTRLVIGGVIFIVGFLCPLLIPFVAASDLSENWKVILSTGLGVGLPEVGMLLAVAVLGKQGFAQLKVLFFSTFRKITEPSSVGTVRHRIGLLMFIVPLLIGWLHPYLAHFFPMLGEVNIITVLLLDLTFASSFIVLGAGFWEKIRNLFVKDYSHLPGADGSSIYDSKGEVQ